MSQLQAMTFQQICYTEILSADQTVLLREWHKLTLNSLLYAKSALPNNIAEHIQGVQLLFMQQSCFLSMFNFFWWWSYDCISVHEIM
jgi:hypothetical protein